MRNRAMLLVAVCSAMLGWAALTLQMMLTLALTHAHGGTVLDGLWRYFGFFTLIANLFAAVVLTLAVLRRTTPRLEFAAVTAMILVGIVYSLLLRDIWNPQGWDKIADVALHDVMPLAVTLFWLLGPHRRLGIGDIAASLILPLGYCVYAMARGALDGWYPYPFIDVRSLGVARVAINCLVIAVLFASLASLLGWLDRKLP